MIKAETSRENLMVEAYGETMSYARAARLLHISKYTLMQFIDSGYISEACGGTKIDTRSVARYIESPQNNRPTGWSVR